ncbi:MAG: type VII toxin-antitoxin system MntA family adenylyltransferase antitoxin [Desulfuromonadaceae bacterium]
MDREQLKAKLTPLFLKYHDEIVAAYLFGSMAKGATTASSDIDIAILAADSDKRRGADLKIRLYSDLCRTLKRNDIDVVLLNLSGNLILNDEIVRHGMVLYTADTDTKEQFEVTVQHRCIDFKFQRQYAMGV